MGRHYPIMIMKCDEREVKNKEYKKKSKRKKKKGNNEEVETSCNYV